MNKQEKIIVALLGAVLAFWCWKSVSDARKNAAKAAAEPAPAVQEAAPTPQEGSVPNAEGPVPNAVGSVPNAVPNAVGSAPKAEGSVPTPAKPEQLAVLSNAQMSVVLTTRGAAVKSATLAGYREKPGAAAPENPCVSFDFSSSPVFALSGVPGLRADADYEIRETGADYVVFANALAERRITLKDGYILELSEKFSTPADGAENALSIGVMEKGTSKNDILSIDSWLPGEKGGKVVHHDEDDNIKGLLSGSSGGCSGSRSADGIPVDNKVSCAGGRSWIAVKSRFFAAALVSASEANSGFDALLRRDAANAVYSLVSVGAEAKFPSVPRERTATVYIGPKKLSTLWSLGMRDVMEFGMWRWICYPIVWTLNLFHSWIPSFGVGIILLTVLVRLVFWPLTHKSTVGMRKMQEIQPLLKEIQKRNKDNPQKLQQETWQCYRDNKVNPLSSCLPMIVQIPVFIALFTVLRSTVELRYAPFLWISDLSEPENLWPNVFPFGGLNILPILMAATMALQSALTPSTGDKAQQRMMMVMMPVMMLVMFYSFPSALSLYWTLSQVLSIAQMWWIRKKYGAPAAVPAVAAEAAPAVTRQMRRHG